MRFLRPFLAGALALAVSHLPAVGFAQEEEAMETPEPEATAAAPSAPDEQGLPIRRGLYATGDFGGYFTFGGRNTSVPSGQPLPSKSVSNFQPMIGVTLGYDLVSTESINLATGLRLAATYNAGSAQISAAEATESDARTIPSDFGIYQVGLGTKLGFMVLERLAVNAIVDVGLGIGNPDPSASASVPGGGSATFGLAFGAGAGLEFFTLFPGFSVGLDLRFMGSLLGGKFIPGLGITAPLKYNF